MEFEELGNSKVFLSEWKLTASEEHLKEFYSQLKAVPSYGMNRYLFAVPYMFLEPIAKMVDSKYAMLGCSDLNSADPGAFTETIAGRMAAEKGAKFALIGSRYNRIHRHEESSSINRKIHSALGAGMVPFLCVGESSAEAISGEGLATIRKQFEEATAELSTEQLQKLAVVFEAPWIDLTLEDLSGSLVLDRFKNYRTAIEESVGAGVAASLRYFYRYSDDILEYKPVYTAFAEAGIYASPPQSLLRLLNSTSTWDSGENEPATIEPVATLLKNEIPLILDVEDLENELSSSIIPEISHSQNSPEDMEVKDLETPEDDIVAKPFE